MKFLGRRGIAALSGLVVVAFAVAGCASGSAGSVGSAPQGSADGVVKIEGPLVGNDATLLEQSWSAWEKANNIKIEYTGSANFEESIGTEAQQGNAPDLAIFQQPGLIGDLATRGYLRKLPAGVKTSLSKNFPSQWAGYTTFGGAQYAVPLLATINGWVYYSPKQFASWGVTVPKTWAELVLLTEDIQAKTKQPAWCEGFSADSASGAAGASWISDLVLRDEGPQIYDEWVDHKIPFNDARIKNAFNSVAQILLSKNSVNAGIGSAATINTASTSDVAAAMESGKCAMTRQSSDFVADLTKPDGTASSVSPQGDFWVFMLPALDSTQLTPVTTGGNFVAAFSNDADTVKVQEYLAGTAWANSRVSLGGAVSPNVNVSPGEPSTLLSQQSTTMLQQFGRVFRFDGASLMPSVVGAGTFLTGMVDWVKGAPTGKVLATIDDSWPDN
jgi:alpha-glucoside transport system substrate-binding protein